MVRILLGILALSLSGSAQTAGPLTEADQFFEKEQYAPAAAAFEKLPEIAKSAAVLNRLGISYHMLNRVRDAESAYRRGDMLAKRAKLMQAWADYCEPKSADKVIPMSRGAKR